jgi:hypothetical protein
LLADVKKSIQQLMGQLQLSGHRKLLGPSIPQQPAAVVGHGKSLARPVNGIDQQQITSLTKALLLSDTAQDVVITGQGSKTKDHLPGWTPGSQTLQQIGH